MAEETLRETLTRVVSAEAPTEEPKAEPLAAEELRVEEPRVEEPKSAEPKELELKAVEPKEIAPKVVEDLKGSEEPKPPSGGIRAPESWKPALREQHWAKLPVAVQAEIHRRERQVMETMQHASEARKGMEQLSAMTSQYKDVFEYEKLPPLQTINNLLSISRTLRFSPPPQRAQLMAQVIQGFNVDIRLLDQVLSMGVQQQQDPMTAQNQLIEQAVAKQMKPMQEFMSNMREHRETARATENQRVQSEIAAFADDPQNEYFEVVRDSMADILEASANRGQKISLQDAYQRAILSDNDLAEKFSRSRLTEAASRVGAPAAVALQKAGLSVTGSPGGVGTLVGGGNLRSDIEAAIAQHSGRR
jgi:hypothetical protein